MDRRTLLLGGTALVALGAFGVWRMGSRPATIAAAQGSFEIAMTPEEWQARLGPERYDILRQEGTEYPYSSPLNDEHREGIFACAGCELPLFSSATKFESGTGWPSFYEPLPGAVGESTDTSLLMVRTEVHCARCGGHLGHVFNDGPPPTGLRYCMNGLSLIFQPTAA